MSDSTKNQQDLPESYAEALGRLNKSGSDRNYRSMSYMLKGARVVTLRPRYRSQRIENPARRASVWGYLTAERYVWTEVRDLPDLYIDGKWVGRLHGGSEDQAQAVGSMLAVAGPKDVVISGHFTESGWFVDSVTLAS